MRRDVRIGLLIFVATVLVSKGILLVGEMAERSRMPPPPAPAPIPTLPAVTEEPVDPRNNGLPPPGDTPRQPFTPWPGRIQLIPTNGVDSERPINVNPQ